jgi:hypothetical protein
MKFWLRRVDRIEIDEQEVTYYTEIGSRPKPHGDPIIEQRENA